MKPIAQALYNKLTQYDPETLCATDGQALIDKSDRLIRDKEGVESAEVFLSYIAVYCSTGF